MRETKLAAIREEGEDVARGGSERQKRSRREEVVKRGRRETEKERESFGAVKSVSRGQCQRLTLRGSWQA